LNRDLFYRLNVINYFWNLILIGNLALWFFDKKWGLDQVFKSESSSTSQHPIIESSKSEVSVTSTKWWNISTTRHSSPWKTNIQIEIPRFSCVQIDLLNCLICIDKYTPTWTQFPRVSNSVSHRLIHRIRYCFRTSRDHMNI
jgi:hypothetical protein